ncbi:MAG TPA: hypothetical protein VG897_04345 [Terriglobales bacterium]|nr:hypothetical protein [Terriglobales bacterium]
MGWSENGLFGISPNKTTIETVWTYFLATAVNSFVLLQLAQGSSDLNIKAPKCRWVHECETILAVSNTL